MMTLRTFSAWIEAMMVYVGGLGLIPHKGGRLDGGKKLCGKGVRTHIHKFLSRRDKLLYNIALKETDPLLLIFSFISGEFLNQYWHGDAKKLLHSLASHNVKLSHKSNKNFPELFIGEEWRRVKLFSIYPPELQECSKTMEMCVCACHQFIALSKVCPGQSRIDEREGSCGS